MEEKVRKVALDVSPLGYRIPLIVFLVAWVVQCAVKSLALLGEGEVIGSR